MFAYPEEASSGQSTNQVFFTRLAQRLIKVLHTVTAEGMVYRVDMRLRPFGDSGPLVMNYAALAAYFLAREERRIRSEFAEVRINEAKKRLEKLKYPPFDVLAKKNCRLLKLSI